MVEGLYFEKPASGSSADALHYYVKERGGGVDLQFPKNDGTTTGISSETISMDDFQARFTACSEHTACKFKKKSAAEKKAEQVAKMVEVGLKHLENEEFSSATFELGRVLKEDSENLQAHLGKGKAHMALGETDKALEHFDAMADNADLYTEENKHTFNQLGIELRQNKLFEEAVRNYTKALKIDPKDEVLYYNLSRAYKEWGKEEEAAIYIKKALDINSDFKEAKAYLQLLENR